MIRVGDKIQVIADPKPRHIFGKLYRSDFVGLEGVVIAEQVSTGEILVKFAKTGKNAHLFEQNEHGHFWFEYGEVNVVTARDDRDGTQVKGRNVRES